MDRYLTASIKATLLNAMRHPYYQKHWNDIDVESIEAADAGVCIEILNTLPSTPKDAMAKFLHPIPLDGDSIVRIGHTTGTTGSPQMWYTTEKERRAWAAIKSRLSRERGSDTSLKKLGMRISPPFHGITTSPYSETDSTYLFNCSVRDDHAFATTKWLLTGVHEIPGFETRVSELVCTPNILVTLTEALIGSGLKASDLGVKRIGLYGGYFNHPYRHFIHTFWDIHPVDLYSTSEILGGGVVCRRCGRIEFSPHIHARIAPLGTGPGIEGPGMLLLTALFPFNTAQPLINFENGDLAEYIDSASACCSGHIGGIRVIGRRSKSVVCVGRGKTRVVLTSHQIHDVFFGEGVDRLRKPFEGLSMLPGPSPLTGLPLVDIPVSVNLGSELLVRYAPDPHSRVSPAEIRDRLLRSSGSLREFVSREEILLNVVADEHCSETIWK